MMIEKYGTVKMEDWGKDHWSMLAYIECRCVDYKGVLDYNHLRCNSQSRPEISPEKMLPFRSYYRIVRWEDKHSTRIKGGEQIRGHCDWDCMEDLQAVGFVEIVSMTDLQIKMTELGWKVINLLRQHKAVGGVYSSFQCTLEGLTV